MKFPLFFWLVLVLVAVAVVVAARWGKTRSMGSVSWLANTAALRTLPAYQNAKRNTRTTMIAAGLLLTGLTLAAAVSAGAPVDRQNVHPHLASRDIVLCLDASGSMLPYDSEILENFQELVEGFDGERISLQLWSAQTLIKFPLTDDYELADEVLGEASSLIRSGYIRPEGDYVLVTPELHEYLDGISAPDGQNISSLVGDGLATCVLGFDQMDQDRSRTILLATDNEVMGPQIYTLVEAVEFATAQGVDIIALYPADGGVLTAEGEQLRNVVEGSGGSFYNVQDPAAVDAVIDAITAKELSELAGPVEVVETDRPRTALLWTLWLLLGFTALVGWRRI